MNQSQSELSKLIEDYFAKRVYDNSPQNLYSPVNYIMSGGGKKIRSFLTLLGYLGYDENVSNALPLAYSTELFHNFTLVHDDIMDEAPIRRGNPSVHTEFDVNSAILSGDVMHSLVINILTELKSDYTLDIIKRFSETAILVCEGQSFDMTFEEQDEVSMKEYLKMIEMKTAVLIGYALESGALLAGAGLSKAHHLYLFGKNAGIAFQLQDDYLDLYGESFKVGKQKCGDIIQKKKNFFFVKAIELLEGQENEEFKSLYNSDLEVDVRVNKVLAVYDELYLKLFMAESKKAYMDLALSHLAAAGYNSERKDVLKSMAMSLADRDQ